MATFEGSNNIMKSLNKLYGKLLSIIVTISKNIRELVEYFAVLNQGHVREIHLVNYWTFSSQMGGGVVIVGA